MIKCEHRFIKPERYLLSNYNVGIFSMGVEFKLLYQNVNRFRVTDVINARGSSRIRGPYNAPDELHGVSLYLDRPSPTINDPDFIPFGKVVSLPAP